MSCLFVWNNLAASADTSNAPALDASWPNAWQPDLINPFDTGFSNLRWSPEGTAPNFSVHTNWPISGVFAITVPTHESPIICIAKHTINELRVTGADGYTPGNVAIDVQTHIVNGMLEQWQTYQAQAGSTVQMGYLLLTTGAGQLSMPYGLAPPFTRPSHANRHRIINAPNDGKALIGRALQEQYFETTLHFKHLPMAWYDANFAPMLDYWKSQPVFFRWHQDYPQDDCLLWLAAKGGKFPEPRLGKGMLVSISLPVVGYV